VFFSFYIIYLDLISGVASAIQLTFVQVTVNAILAIGSSLLFERTFNGMSGSAAAIVIYLTIFATVLTTLAQTRYQRDTTPTRAAIIFSGEPVFAAIFAGFVLQEHLGPLGMLGGGLILAGILISELSGEIRFLNRPVLRIEPRLLSGPP
jgi:drug/metabolite transporter (DMT)-like permease